MNNKRIICYCLLICLLIPTFTHAKIVFKSYRDDSRSLYVMDDNGRNVQRVTTDSVTWPVWSPDGKQIAFSKHLPVAPGQSQQKAIFIINSDGSNLRRLTDDHEENLNGGRLFETNCSWSPDGQHIVFTSGRHTIPGKAQSDLYTIHLETKVMRRLTRGESLSAFPTWSPDGKYIAYRDTPLNRIGYPTIFVMHADGSGKHELAEGDADRYRLFPRWSVDSQSVVYIEDTLGFVAGVFDRVLEKAVIHNIKTGKRRIVDTPDNWSIHSACFMGRKYLLITAKGMDGNPSEYDIYRYHLVTGEIVNLTNTPAASELFMDWISDDVLPVTPQDKKKVTWGTLKE